MCSVVNKNKKVTHVHLKLGCQCAVLERKEWLPIVKRALDFQLSTCRFRSRYHYGPLVLNQWIFALVLTLIVPIFYSSLYILRFSIAPKCTNSFIVKLKDI